MDTTGRPAIVGVFDNRERAEAAIDELYAAGFEKDQLGIALRGEQEVQERLASIDESLDEGTGTVGGAVTGGIAGGVIGALLTGLIPGVGPVIAAGALVGVLGGAVAGAAVGGLAGTLIDMGISEPEASHYEREFMAGRTVVTVRPGGRQDDAIRILRSNGARDLSGTGEMTSTLDRAETRDVQEPFDPEVKSMGDHDEERIRYRGAEAEVTTTGENPARDLGPRTIGEDSPTSPFNVEISEVGKPDDYSHSERWEDVAPTYRARWENRFGGTGERWEHYEPRYRYAWERRRQPEYHGRRWHEVELDLRRDWEDQHHEMTFEEASDAIRDAWEHRDLGAPIVDDKNEKDRAA